MNAGTIESQNVTQFVPNPDMLERYAELIVCFAANVQPGQFVAITTEPGKEALTRCVADAAYSKAGAGYVEAISHDPYVTQRARIKGTVNETDLDFLPEWPDNRLRELSARSAARISLVGLMDPRLLHGLDPERAGRIELPGRGKVLMEVINKRTTNWAAVPHPTDLWAAQVHPDLEPAAATQKLWEQIIHMCRLDEDDPVAAWKERQDFLVSAAARLTEHRFSALHFEGPGPDGTDLTVGLLPSSQWISARFKTVDGITHMPNLPSEEIFTAPDPLSVNGRVRATKPLDLEGTIIKGLDIVFEDGRAVSVNATEGAEALRRHLLKDEGASRLGEVALVDRDGLIGPLNTTFFNTLVDENAGSHLALGSAYSFTVGPEDRARINDSKIHDDFMIGSPDMHVTGITADGQRVPVLIEGVWQI